MTLRKRMPRAGRCLVLGVLNELRDLIHIRPSQDGPGCPRAYSSTPAIQTEYHVHVWHLAPLKVAASC